MVSTIPHRALQAALTPVFVHGANFANSSTLGCAFGTMRTNATFISNNTIVCVAPVWTSLVRDEMRVPLRVTTNGADYSPTTAMFEYVTCPDGAYCSHLQVLPCPRGAACHGGGGANLSACSPGTYQPRVAQASCEPCPIGSYCPAPGLPGPLICAAGMVSPLPSLNCPHHIAHNTDLPCSLTAWQVCSLPGLAFPNSNCPAGHFCPPGVETLDPVLSDTDRRPLECPENTWCPPGVAENITRPGNLSTPQPCLSGFVCYRGAAAPQGSGPCPSGYYCPPKSLPVECPPAHYCPGVGNVFPSQCTPGFYNDKYGRNRCIECPIGYICDRTGLSQPTICPAGAVCNEPGLKVLAFLAPPTHPCPRPRSPCFTGAVNDVPTGILLLGGYRDCRLERRDDLPSDRVPLRCVLPRRHH